MKLNLNIENLENFDIDEIIIKKIIKNIIKNPKIIEKSCFKAGLPKILSVDFVFCNDEFIHKINKEYRGFDKPTDVISFALFCDDPNSIMLEEINLGEIIISVDTAKKQAAENNHSIFYEIYYLITHGILHLLGFDHQTEQEYNYMVTVQKDIMEKTDVKI